MQSTKPESSLSGFFFELLNFSTSLRWDGSSIFDCLSFGISASLLHRMSILEEKVMRKNFIPKLKIVSFAVVLMGATVQAQAIELLNGFGGVAGYGSRAVLPNDDSSSGQMDLPFLINFFGQSFNNFYINNNGNISFARPLSTYTPNPFPVTNQPMIAPYWADVDTRNQTNAINGSNNVYVASPNPDSLIVTWHNVGYYSNSNDKLNNFQLVLQKSPIGDIGSFTAEFRYQRLEWTTGNASGGTQGLGGTPAQAGYDAGDNINYETLPGSRTANVLDLVNTSNVSTETPGLWRFSFNNGALPGQTAENAFLPVVINDAFTFNFNVQPEQRVFIDPVVSTGYDYEITSGDNFFTSVLLPILPDDLDGYEIYALNDNSPSGFLGSVLGGEVFNFLNPITGFTVLGIDTAAMLDPANVTAFVTGLTFQNAGVVGMSQTPITTYVPSAVPEPGSYGMLVIGLMLISLAKRRRS